MQNGAENKLKVTLDPRPAASIDAEALVSYVFESENEQGPVEGVIAELDRAAGGTFSRLAASGELTGKTGEMTLVHFAPGLAAQRVLLVGAGKRGKFGAAELRRLAATAVRYFKARAVKRVAFVARETHGDAAFAQAVTEGLILGSFDGDKYRTDKTAKPDKPDKPDKSDKADKSEASGKPSNRKAVESVALAGFDGAAQAGIDRGTIIAESQNFTRELGNEPSNLLTPSMLAERAAAMAAETGLAIEILDEKRMAELKMGAILSVARGSVEPPRMIVLTYTPSGASGARTASATSVCGRLDTSASDASRSSCGTNRTISSVVLVTKGIMMVANATAPAMVEKPPIGRTTTAYAKMPTTRRNAFMCFIWA